LIKIATGQISVGTSATEIVASRAGRKELRLYGVHPGPSMALGPDNSVSLTTNLINTHVSSAPIILPMEGAVWGIVDAGSRVVSYIEIYED
jgi:hypothetical protein